MKRLLPTLLILIILFITSCTTETAKEYNVLQSLDSYNVDTASFKNPQDTENQTTSVYVTDFGKKYHEYGCRYLQYSCIEKDLQQAIDKGYTPCSICITP